jgi:hypothetical protein
MPVTRSWQSDLDQAEYEKQLAARRTAPKVEPIDLDALVVAVLDGAVGDRPMTSMETMDGACDAVVAEVAKRIGRPLMDGALAKVYVATGCEFNRRRAQKKADLAETQQALCTRRCSARGQGEQ